jgi:hypothetical protein
MLTSALASLLFALIPGQAVNFQVECDSVPCVIDNIPFGVGRETVDWQMRQIAPLASRTIFDGGIVYHYDGYKFQGIQQSRFVDFIFSTNGALREIGVFLSPTANDDNRFPEVLNLYFTMRDRIVESRLYDSVEFVYSFKRPYSGTPEKDAIAGDFTGQEEDALIQDRNGNLSKYRFGKVWSIFKNRKHPSLMVTLSVAIQEGATTPSVNLQYTDTRYTKRGKVEGIENPREVR